MTLLSTLKCDEATLTEWTSGTITGSGVIEQVAGSARNGPRGLHAVGNGGVAYAQLNSWATVMGLGDIRVVGCYCRIQAYPSGFINILRLNIGGVAAGILSVDGTGRVRLRTQHDLGESISSTVPCFATLNQWVYIRLAIIRHGSTGGAQLYGNPSDVDALIIDDTSLNTSTRYDGAMTSMMAGVQSASGTELDMDHFQIATTVDEAGPKTGGGRMLRGIG